jgi:Mn-dependent DtxR family transcriptional regulator
MPAERVEHYIDADLEQRIEADLPSADTDPHGRIIPDLADAGEPD